MTLSNKLLEARRLAIKIGKRLPVFSKKSGKQIYLRDRIKQYEYIWSSIATEIGATVTKLDTDLWELKHESNSIRACLNELPLDNNVVLKLCGRKPLVHKLLSAKNIPVPDYQIFYLSNIQPALDFLVKFPNGCVVKPCDGYSGLGVTTHIKRPSELKHAAALASVYHDDLMIERQIPGENYRLLIYKGQMLHAVKRSGEIITGNGKSTIADLLHLSPTQDIESLDRDLSFTLKAQNLSLDKILNDGTQTVVRSVGGGFNGGEELRTIYDEDVTNIIHQSVKSCAEQCANIAQAQLVGVDIITLDITKDLVESGGVINEINTTPALHHHYDSEKEEYPVPALAIVKDLFKIV